MPKITMKSLVILLFMIAAVCAKGKDPDTECDGRAPVQNRTVGELDLKQSIDQLAGKTCEWIIDGTNFTKELNIHLDLVEDLILSENDSLVITTNESDEKKRTTLYETKGFQSQGVILLGKKNTIIRVKLILSNDTINRNFDVKYGINQSSVQIQDIDRSGKFSFLYNKDADVSTDFTVVLKTKINSKNLLMNLETLDLNGGIVSFDKVRKYNENQTFDGKTTPDFLLSDERQINIKLSKLQKLKNDSKGLQLHYDLVDSVCSQYLQTPDLDQTGATIDVPLPKKKDLQSLSSYRCLNIVEHVNPSAKLLLDLRSFKFVNTGDLITVLDGNSYDSKTLAVIESQFLEDWRNQYLYSSSNKMWIMFDSTQVINRDTNPSPFGIQPLSQGGSFVFNTSASNTTSLEINTKTKPPTPLVFTFITDSDKQIMIDFDEETPLPGPGGQNLMEIYESVGKNGEPFIKLNSGQKPPDIMASNTNQLKVVFKQIVNFTKSPEISTVKRGCHSTYLGASGASFSQSGSCSPLCSWLIPQKENSNGTYILQFSHLNLPKESDVLIIEMLGTNPSTVLNVKGPLKTEFPDLILDANQTYVLYMRRQCEKTTPDSQLIGVSLNFLDEDLTTHEMTVDKNTSTSLGTNNYPNYYSVGSDHKWRIGGGNQTVKALLSLTDIDLSPNHVLVIMSKNFLVNTSNSKLTDLSDYLVELPLFLNLNSKSIDDKKQPFSGRGFMANLTTADCGGSFTVVSGESLTVATNSTLTGISKCIWTVSTNNPNDSALNVLDFTVNDGNDKDFDWKSLRVWDSKSMRDNKFINFTYFNTSRKSSSTNSLVIEYTIDAKNPKPLNLTFKQTVCTAKCIYTKRCLLPEFFCNGFNDCGDFSDERCNGSTPIPPPPTPEPAPIVYHSGVNGWVVTLVICPLMIGIGVLGVIFGPRLLTRVGRGRYREFQDFSEVS